MRENAIQTLSAHAFNHKGSFSLLSFSTQAVGMSGRNDARQYLYSLIPNVKDKDFIVSAVYKLDLIDEYGWEKWKHEIYPPPFRLYLQWSEKHPEWGKWRKGGPLPPLEESAGEE